MPAGPAPTISTRPAGLPAFSAGCPAIMVSSGAPGRGWTHAPQVTPPAGAVQGPGWSRAPAVPGEDGGGRPAAQASCLPRAGRPVCRHQARPFSRLAAEDDARTRRLLPVVVLLPGAAAARVKRQ